MIPLLLAALTQAGTTEVYSRPIADTFIDSQAPNTNYGREGYLKGGPGRAILIDFPGLTLHRGPIESASLILTATEGLGAELTSVSIIRAPWRQGIGGRLVKSDLAANLEGATWTQRGGEAAWTTPGAADSTPVEGPAAGWVEDRLVITGLGGALNEMMEHPAAHFGIRLEFGQPCIFVSADEEMSAPLLRFERGSAPPYAGPRVVELKPGQNQWQAAIASPAGGEAIWRLDGREFARTPFSSGDQTVSAALPADSGSTLGVVSVEAVAGEASDSLEYSTSAQSVYVGGASADQARIAVDHLNQAIFPNSFSVFTPGGVRQRLRLVRAEAEAAIKVTASGGAPDIARAILKQMVTPNRAVPPMPINSWALTNDSRDDSLYLPNIPIPDQGWMPRLPGVPGTPAYGMLGRFEMGMLERLHNKTADERSRYRLPMPANQLFLRMFDFAGTELTETAFKVWRTATDQPEGNPIFDQKSAGPNVLITLEGEPRNLLIEAAKGGLTERRLIPWTRLSDEAMRVGESLASLEVRWPLAGEAIDRTKNEAAGALVADSSKSPPVRLISVVDGKPDTSLSIPASGSYWLELDLGRDMRIGEIELVFLSEVPDLVDIQLYQTAEKPEWAVFWMRDRGASLRAEVLEMGRLVRYRAASMPGRYVRIWMNPRSDLKLAEVRVFDVNR